MSQFICGKTRNQNNIKGFFSLPIFQKLAETPANATRRPPFGKETSREKYGIDVYQQRRHCEPHSAQETFFIFPGRLQDKK